jgi:UDP-glucose:tetrahydrobiopterin glucosyltransferase
MRVAFVASLVSPIRPAEANGPHSVIVDLACGLTERGHQIEIYAAAGSVVDGVRVIEIEVEPDVRLASIRPTGKTTGAGGDASERGFRRLYAELRWRDPDVVSQHAFDAPAIELARGLPVVHTLHLPPAHPDVVRAARRSTGALVTVSTSAARGWRAAGVRDIRVIRNGVPTVAPVDAPPLDIALIAGRVSPEKGTHIGVRVARRAGLEPRVVGDIYDADYFASKVAPLLESGQTIEPLARGELARLMARSRVLIMPIRWEEPFGLVAAEAQMSGCPVVGFRRGALPEIVIEGIGGYLVEPEDEDGLVGAVRRAGGLDRSAIRANAIATLGVERMVDDYERLLGRVANGAVAA